MSVIQLTTYHDAVSYLIDYAGGDAQQRTLTDAQRAVVNGYREFTSSHDWSYYFARHRITTSEPYDTGTVTYVNSTRELTLSGGTWPTWAAYGSVIINQIPYEVASRTSATVLVLSQSSNPGEDIATATSFEIYRDTFPMPCDYLKGFDMLELTGGQLVLQVTNSDWLSPQQLRAGPAKPSRFAVTADPNYFGVLACRFHPRPDQAYSFDFIYHRRPRQLNIMDYSSGVVSVSNGSASVSGSSTAWASKHIGAVIRFAATGEKYAPTGREGAYPYAYERVVTSVSAAGALEVDEVLPETLTNVKYRISDPMDLEEGAFMTAFWRECERQLRSYKRMKALNVEDSDYQLSYARAREADSRSMSLRVAGGMVAYRLRFSDMPSGPDVD